MQLTMIPGVPHNDFKCSSSLLMKFQINNNKIKYLCNTQVRDTCMGVSITEKLVLVLLVAIPINTNHEIPCQRECKRRSQASVTNIDVVFGFLHSILTVSAYSITIRVSDFNFTLVMEFLGSDEGDIGGFHGGAVHCGCLAQRHHHPCFNTSGLVNFSS